MLLKWKTSIFLIQTQVLIGQCSFPHDLGGVLVISQSGETKDVHRALQLAQSHGLPCMSIVNSVGSLIARYTCSSIALLLIQK